MILKQKIASIVVALLSVMSVHAQVKGTFSVGAMSTLNMAYNNKLVTYNGNKINDANIFIVNFKPMAGYFFIDHFCSGLFVDYSYAHASVNGNALSEYNLSGGAYFRYFFQTKGIFPFIHTDIAYASEQKTDPDDVSKMLNFNGISANLGGGVSYALTKKIAADAALLYGIKSVTLSTDTRRKEKTSGLGLSFGMTINF